MTDQFNLHHTVFIVWITLEGSLGSLIVKPLNVVADVNGVASFSCRTNRDEGIRWFRTVNGRDSYIYSGGNTYPGWTRHVINQSSPGLFVLTISPVVWNDSGNYSCMDRADDDTQTAILTVVERTTHLVLTSTVNDFSSVSSDDETTETEQSFHSNFPNSTKESKNMLDSPVAVVVVVASTLGGMVVVIVIAAIYTVHRRKSRRHSDAVGLKTNSLGTSTRISERCENEATEQRFYELFTSRDVATAAVYESVKHIGGYSPTGRERNKYQTSYNLGAFSTESQPNEGIYYEIP